MTTWTEEELGRIGEARELQLASVRPDGTLRPHVRMWVVRADDELYVRSAYGPNNPWFRRAKASGAGRIRAGGLERDVSFAEPEPGVHGGIDAAYVSNVDIAPTIASLLSLPWGADGRSLVPILSGTAGSVRSALLIEHCRGVSRGTPPCSGLSFYGGQTRAAGFEGVMTSRYKYVRYDDGTRELFDLRADPFELSNLIGTPSSAPIVTDLRTKLAALLGPRIQTTIVTGPSLVGSRLARFSFFSPSRFSTYRCRLVRDGVPDAWHPCDGQTDAIGGLPDGTYSFEVAGVDELGRVDPSPASLHPFVTAHVEPGATVITDGWQGYSGIEKLGYVHDRRSQRAARARGEDPGGLLPGVHRVASLAKRWLLGTHQGCRRGAPAELPRRVRVPLQPAGIPEQGAALLPRARARRRPRSGALSRLGHQPAAEGGTTHAGRETGAPSEHGTPTSTSAMESTLTCGGQVR